jgi:hypothetical protein
MGMGAFFPQVKWPEHEADHSLPASTKVKNVLPQYVFMVKFIIKHRDITFYLYL